jgi:hypothetical protein
MSDEEKAHDVWRNLTVDEWTDIVSPFQGRDSQATIAKKIWILGFVAGIKCGGESDA